MSIIQSSASGSFGAPVPHDPFSDKVCLYVDVPAANSGSQPTFQAVANAPEVNNIQAFNSGVFGSPTAEDIWAFKANRLAQMAAALAAVTQDLANTAGTLNRPDWQQRIPKLNQVMQEAFTESKALCDAVASARSK